MPIEFYGATQAANEVWNNTETINGQKTFSDTIIGDISSNGTSYFTDICANRIYSNPDAGQALIIDSSLAIPDACFNILSDGKVGIGTTTPKVKLSVAGDFNFTDDNKFLGWNIIYETNVWKYVTAGYAGTIKFDNDGHFGFNTAVQGTAGNVAGLTQHLTIQNNGNVGIGITTPHVPLHVIGGHVPSGSISTADQMTYFAYGHPGLTTRPANTTPVHRGLHERTTIYGENNIVSGYHIISAQGSLGASDSRIKNNIQDIDDSTALNILRQLKPKTYGYNDLVARGSEEVVGFIAQEVKELIPSGVSITTQFLPNIYCVSTLGPEDVVEFDTNKLITGDNVTGRISLRDKNNTERILEDRDYTVISTGIQVSKDISEYVGDNNEIFVYGQEVNDFNLLKKESIFTVATAALQEVDRQLQAEKAKTATLETKVATLEAENTDLRADIELIKEHLGISTEVG